MSEQQDRQADWEGRMEAEGWVAVRDIWNHIVAWRHTRTGARIEGANISVWEQTGSTPPSF